MARISLEPWPFTLDIGSSSHRGLIIELGQVLNWKTLGIRIFYKLYVEYYHYNRLDEAILVNTHNTNFHTHCNGKIRKIPKNIFIYLFSLAIRIGLCRDSVTVNKPSVFVVIEVLLY